MCQVVAKRAMAVSLNSGLCVHGTCKLVVQASLYIQREEKHETFFVNVLYYMLLTEMYAVIVSFSVNQ